MGLRQWVQGLGFRESRYWDIGRGFGVVSLEIAALNPLNPTLEQSFWPFRGGLQFSMPTKEI